MDEALDKILSDKTYVHNYLHYGVSCLIGYKIIWMVMQLSEEHGSKSQDFPGQTSKPSRDGRVLDGICYTK